MMKISTHFCAALLLFLITLSAPGAPDSIEGHWQGALVRDGAVQVIICDFFRDAGTLKARIETPDMVTSEPPPVPASFENGKVQFETAFGKATLTIDASVGEMMGTVGEANPPIRIHLKRAFKPVEVSFRTEDVQFRNGQVTLSGTLVTPDTPGPYPALVWIHGRGKSARGGFRGSARILAQRGIASLIYDKRGVGTSTGDHDRSGMYDFAGDALAAVEFLATRAEIDRQQIGLHGTSAGGWVAAIVASRTKIPLAFIITNVGPADSVRDQQIHVAEYSMRQSGIDFTPEEYAAAAHHMGLVQDFAYTGKGWEALRASVVKAKPTRWARFVDLPESESYEDIAWVRLNQYDPGPDLKKITAPFLALYGGSDYVVPPEENAKKLERYLTAAGNRDFKIMTFPGADHGLTIPSQLRRMGSEVPEKHYWLWRKRAPGVIETTVDWLLQRIKPRRAADKIDPEARYLFYISGYLVEAGNTRPTSPKFGVYEYERILETFKQSGFVVISEARQQTLEIEPYAAKVAEQVRQLLRAGVPPRHITVVGASQGSWIAMLTSTYLENRKVNFVVIGSCAADDGLLQLVNLHGNVLFISERTDLPARCQRFRADATGLGESKEVETNTGQKHGFLFRPMKEWVEPTIAWAKQ